MLYLLEDIRNTSGDELNQLLMKIVERYEVVFPDWSITIITLEKSRDRNEQLDRIIAHLQAIKEMDEM